MLKEQFCFVLLVIYNKFNVRGGGGVHYAHAIFMALKKKN